MRWRLAAILLAAVILAPATVTYAAPADIGRKPDVDLMLCTQANGARDACMVRAIGDVNGDRFDDLVVQRMSMAELQGSTTLDPRRFEVYLAPLAPGMQPATSLTLSTGQPRPSLNLVDVDADGKRDLVFSASQLKGREQAQRIAVILGRARGAWASEYDLRKASIGDIVIERTKVLAGQAAPFSPDSVITAGFGDVNADGHLDVVMAADPMLLSQLDQAKTHASGAASEIAVMFGDGVWRADMDFRDDLRIADVGACAESLAGVADVSGDGVADIVMRRCEGQGLPDKLEIVTGRAGIATATLEPASARLPDLGSVLDPSSPLADGIGTYAVDNDNPDVPPPDPGRGYLPGGGVPVTPFFPAPFFLEDVNGDAVRDIVLGFGNNTHIWLGGDGIAAKVAEMRTDRVFVEAGYGRMSATQSWRPIDLSGDGGRDLLLTQREDATDPAVAASCPPNARCMPSGADRSRVNNLGKMLFYQQGWADVDVLDLESDAPQAIWDTQIQTAWGMGDFNGDGQTDLLLGPADGSLLATNAAGTTGMSIAFGPFQ